jgi:tRNA(fMet)-specific endonuclease VapC
MSKTPDAAILERLDAHGPECAIAAPVWHELTYGCRRLPKGKRRTALEAYLRDVVHGSFPILPYDEAAAAWHGEERARLEALGRPAPLVDGQIAAIAHVNGLVLTTTNARDFARFKGLTVENWSKR